MRTEKTTRRAITIALLACLAFIGCDSSERKGDPAGASAGSAYDASNTARELAAALDDPDPYARARKLGALLPRLGPESVKDVRQSVENFRLGLGAVEFELLLRFWAAHDPATATAWSFQHASPIYQAAAARTTVESWAASDPAAAVAAIEQALPTLDEQIARVVETALVRGWFRTDRSGLEAFIRTRGSGIRRQRAIFAYALSLAAADGGEATIRWAEAIPDDDKRYKLAVNRQVMSALAWADMEAALRFCAAHCDGDFGKGMRNVLIRTRLNHGEPGEEVVEWVARAPEENEVQRENKHHSVWVAYSTWAYRDRDAAIAWMGEKLSGDPEPWVGLLIGEYSRQLSADSPAAGIEWAEKIEDDVDRERTLIRIARAWRMQDEASAEAWLEQSSLSEAARSQARDVSKPTYLPGRSR